MYQRRNEGKIEVKCGQAIIDKYDEVRAKSDFAPNKDVLFEVQIYPRYKE